MRKNTKRSAVIAGVAAVVIGGGVAAWAAGGWQIGGTGSGEAQTATITPLGATTTLGTGVTIYPGAKVQATTTVTNTNDFKVKLGGPIKATSVSLAPSGANGCTNELNAALGNSGIVISATFPGAPEIAKKDSAALTSNLVIPMELPQSCAGSRLKINYSFTAESMADPA